MSKKLYLNQAAEREATDIGRKFMNSSDVVGDMSRAYGTDLSSVRIHTDDGAARRTAERGTDAFSTGKDVFFARNAFNKNDPASRGLLAHELGHALQQGVGGETGRLTQSAPMSAEQGGIKDWFRGRRGQPAAAGTTGLAEHRANLSEQTEEQQGNAREHVELLTSTSDSGSLQSNYLGQLTGTSRIGGNSEGFEEILRTLRVIENFMDQVVGNVDVERYRTYLTEAYAALLFQCDNYLQSHSGYRYTITGKRRVRMVRELRAKAENEGHLVSMRLNDIGDFGDGISLRQLLAGMRPLETAQAQVQASDFSLPETELTGDGAASLQALRGTLRADETIDANLRATLDILLEQVSRFSLRTQDEDKKLTADLLDRVAVLCGEAGENETLRQLAEACAAFKAARGLESSSDDDEHMVLLPDVHEDTPYDAANDAGMAYSEYQHMDPAMVRETAARSAYNQDYETSHVYGTTAGGRKHGYIMTSNSGNINGYLRQMHKNRNNPEALSQEGKKTHADFGSLRTIGTLDSATKETPLPQKTRLYRMLTMSYLRYTFGIDIDNDTDVHTGVVSGINKQAGKIVTDTNFMCTGFAVDGFKQFHNYPIMLTLLCDEGTPVFFTNNLAEGEILLGRGTSYMILGTVMHDENGLNVPMSHGDIGDQMAEGKEHSMTFSGLEIFAKVLAPKNKR